MSHTPHRPLLSLLALLALVAGSGCASTRSALAPSMAPLAFAPEALEAPPPPPVLTENHFSGDRSGRISEAGLREVLAAPVFLEEGARLGVVPVRDEYALASDVPLPGVPAALADTLDASGEFELACEVSTDFPTERGISGLRELAARYRADYLLLYRHRFLERSHMNTVAWGYLTVLGAFFLPGETLESAGVLEATLFDVKTGTLLFTVHERVQAEERVNRWHHELKLGRMKQQMLREAARRLADQVVSKVRRLVAARPESLPAGASPRPVLSSHPAPDEVTLSTRGL